MTWSGASAGRQARGDLHDGDGEGGEEEQTDEDLEVISSLSDHGGAHDEPAAKQAQAPALEYDGDKYDQALADAYQ